MNRHDQMKFKEIFLLLIKFNQLISYIFISKQISDQIFFLRSKRKSFYQSTFFKLALAALITLLLCAAIAILLTIILQNSTSKNHISFQRTFPRERKKSCSLFELCVRAKIKIFISILDRTSTTTRHFNN